MSLKDHLPQSVVDALFEEESPKAEALKPAAYSALTPPPITPIPKLASGFVAPVPPITIPNPLIDDLRKRTSFEATPLGQQIQSYVDALSDTGLPEDQKIKTALKLGHITTQSVIETLNGIQAVLDADKQKFDAQMQAAQTTEVDGRQQNIASLDSHISDLESQLNAARQQKLSLTAESNEKAAKITSLRANYSRAYEQRQIEIRQMIDRYQQTSTLGKS